MGLSATQLAVAMGARVIALDVSPERLGLAKEFGAHEVVINCASRQCRVAAIRELTHGEGAHKTLDCSSARRGARRGGARGAVVGHGLLRRRARPGDARREPRPAPPAGHAGRLVDLLASRARPSAPSSSPTTRSTSRSCSRTAGGSTRPRRPTSCSTRRPPARASSCRRDPSPTRHIAWPRWTSTMCRRTREVYTAVRFASGVVSVQVKRSGRYERSTVP